MTSETSKPARLFALDALRVFAIVMMITYHFIYDLKYFGFVDWDTPLGDGFREWRTSIVFGFVFAMGLSMGIAHSHGRRPRSFRIRLAQIFACAALISAVSIFMFPESYIYFGILHFMTLAGLATYALVGRPRLALALGAAIVLAFWTGLVPYGWPINLISGLPGYTEDFVSPFPWFGVAFIGLGLGELYAKNRTRMTRLSEWEIGGGIGKAISFAGSRSLAIYMLHQPVLFGLIIGIGFLIKLVS